MDVGLLFDLRNPAKWQRPWGDHYARTLEFCEEAENNGIGGLWFTEHHMFEDGYLPQPLTFAAAVAARTKRVRIGTSILLPALRKPAQLAEEAAIVDLISGGRLELGLGAGYRVPEYKLFDVEFENRFARTEKSINEVIAFLEDEAVTPSPIQNPMSMWGGFYGPRGAKMAGRLGMGLLHISHSMYEHYREGLIEGGHDPQTARMSGLLPLILSNDPEKTWARIAPHVAHQLNSYRKASVQGTDQPLPSFIGPDELRNGNPEGTWGMVEVVTPEEAAERIRVMTDGLPVKNLIFWASIAAMPDDLMVQHMKLLSGTLPKLIA
ncbi:LLM class flavin-dependent oxidoreductase [Streptomyces sp. 21So2-11]|uniref:LLM class flavin-dependent oxidoreductase n=1 Tax=Streptomyces sp. 21So2-11 TaxID=3144408 RepID=UPI00321A0CBC